MFKNAFEILDLIMADLKPYYYPPIKHTYVGRVFFMDVYDFCKQCQNEGVTNQVATMLRNRNVRVET